MARRKKKDVKSVIKNIKKPGSYAKNVLRSVRLASTEALKELNPVIAETLRTNTDFVKTQYQEIKSKGTENDPVKYVKDNSTKAVRNLINALKSGKFYDEEGAQQATKEQMKALGFDFDMDDLDFDSEEFSTSEEEIFKDEKKIVQKNVVMINGNNNNDNLVDAVVETSTASIKSSAEGMSQVSAILNNILEFHNQNTLGFYNEMSEKITAMATSVARLEKVMAGTAQATLVQMKTTQEGLESILDTNILSLETMINNVKKKRGGGMGSLGLDMVKGEIANFVNNPLGTLMKLGIKKGLPKNLKNAMGKANSLFEDLPILLNMWGERNSKKGGLFGVLSRLVLDATGGKTKYDGNIHHGIKNKKEATHFDNETKTTINRVIPGLLSKILASVSNDPFYKGEIVYDMESGGFVTSKQYSKETKRKGRRARLNTDDANKAKSGIINDMGISDKLGKASNKKKLYEIEEALDYIILEDINNINDLEKLANNPKVSKSVRDFVKKYMKDHPEVFHRMKTSGRMAGNKYSAQVSEDNAHAIANSNKRNGYAEEDITNFFSPYIEEQTKSQGKLFSKFADKVDEYDTKIRDFFSGKDSSGDAFFDRISRAIDDSKLGDLLATFLPDYESHSGVSHGPLNIKIGNRTVGQNAEEVERKKRLEEEKRRQKELARQRNKLGSFSLEESGTNRSGSKQNNVANISMKINNNLTITNNKLDTIIDVLQTIQSNTGSIEGYAEGTDDAEDSFIAGEEGPELVTGRRHARVYNAKETKRILLGSSAKSNTNVEHYGIEDRSILGSMEGILSSIYTELSEFRNTYISINAGVPIKEGLTGDYSLLDSFRSRAKGFKQRFSKSGIKNLFKKSSSGGNLSSAFKNLLDKFKRDKEEQEATEAEGKDRIDKSKARSEEFTKKMGELWKDFKSGDFLTKIPIIGKLFEDEGGLKDKFSGAMGTIGNYAKKAGETAFDYGKKGVGKLGKLAGKAATSLSGKGGLLGKAGGLLGKASEKLTSASGSGGIMDKVKGKAGKLFKKMAGTDLSFIPKGVQPVWVVGTGKTNLVDGSDSGSSNDIDGENSATGNLKGKIKNKVKGLFNNAKSFKTDIKDFGLKGAIQNRLDERKVSKGEMDYDVFSDRMNKRAESKANKKSPFSGIKDKFSKKSDNSNKLANLEEKAKTKELAERAKFNKKELAKQSAFNDKENAEKSAFNKKERLKESLDNAKERAKEVAHNVKDRAIRMAGTVKREAIKAAGTIKDVAIEAASHLKDLIFESGVKKAALLSREALKAAGAVKDNIIGLVSSGLGHAAALAEKVKPWGIPIALGIMGAGLATVGVMAASAQSSAESATVNPDGTISGGDGGSGGGGSSSGGGDGAVPTDTIKELEDQQEEMQSAVDEEKDTQKENAGAGGVQAVVMGSPKTGLMKGLIIPLKKKSNENGDDTKKSLGEGQDGSSAELGSNGSGDGTIYKTIMFGTNGVQSGFIIPMKKSQMSSNTSNDLSEANKEDEVKKKKEDGEVYKVILAGPKTGILAGVILTGKKNPNSEKSNIKQMNSQYGDMNDSADGTSASISSSGTSSSSQNAKLGNMDKEEYFERMEHIICHIGPPSSSGSSSSSSSSANTSGYTTTDENASGKDRVWSFFKQKGLGDVQIAAIMGNINAESGFRSDLTEYGFDAADCMDENNSNCGYGLVGWTWHTFKKDLNKLAQKTGKSVFDMDLQLNYLYDLVANPDDPYGYGYYNTLKEKGFYSSNDPANAAVIFHDNFERSAYGATAYQDRGIPAQRYYEEYKGKSATAVSSNNTSSTTNTGSTATPKTSSSSSSSSSSGSRSTGSSYTSNSTATARTTSSSTGANNGTSTSNSTSGATVNTGGSNVGSDIAWAAGGLTLGPGVSGKGNDGSDNYRKIHDAIFSSANPKKSCDNFVATAVRWSGSDDSYPPGSTRNQDNHLRSSDKWKVVSSGGLGFDGSFLPGGSVLTQAVPGDVIMEYNGPKNNANYDDGREHTWIWTGNEALVKNYPETPSKYVSVSASNPDTGPEMRTGVVSGGRYYRIWRNVKKESNSKYTNAAGIPFVSGGALAGAGAGATGDSGHGHNGYDPNCKWCNPDADVYKEAHIKLTNDEKKESLQKAFDTSKAAWEKVTGNTLPEEYELNTSSSSNSNTSSTATPSTTSTSNTTSSTATPSTTSTSNTPSSTATPSTTTSTPSSSSSSSSSSKTTSGSGTITVDADGKVTTTSNPSGSSNITVNVSTADKVNRYDYEKYTTLKDILAWCKKLGNNSDSMVDYLKKILEALTNKPETPESPEAKESREKFNLDPRGLELIFRGM